MVYCSDCGKKINDNSNFCDECGKKINEKIDDELTKNIENFTKKTANNLEKNAEILGKKFEKFGKRIEQRFDKSAKRIESWHDRYFGIFGPIIGSFLGLIIFRIIIEIMALNPTDFPIMAKTSELLYPYQLIFFGLMLLSSYTNYFIRKYDLFKLISPITTAIGFIITIWIFSTIYNELFDTFENFPNFTIISNFIIDYIFILFIIAIIVGYIVNIFQLFHKKEVKENNNVD
jgi:hypothetical protein